MREGIAKIKRARPEIFARETLKEINYRLMLQLEPSLIVPAVRLACLDTKASRCAESGWQLSLG